MPGLADFFESVDQDVLAVRLERNIELDHSALGRVTQYDPFVRNVGPLVSCKHFAPRCWEMGRESTGEKDGSKDREDREPLETHN